MTQPTQQKNDDRPAASVKLKVYKFQENWQSGQDWLMFDKDRNVMFCDVCQKFDKSKKLACMQPACRLRRSQIVVHIDLCWCRYNFWLNAQSAHRLFGEFNQRNAVQVNLFYFIL